MRKFLIILCAGALLFSSTGMCTSMKLVAKETNTNAVSEEQEEAKRQIAEVKELVIRKKAALERAATVKGKKISSINIIAKLITFVIGVILSIGNVVAEAIVDLFEWIRDGSYM